MKSIQKNSDDSNLLYQVGLALHTGLPRIAGATELSAIFQVQPEDASVHKMRSAELLPEQHVFDSR